MAVNDTCEADELVQLIQVEKFGSPLSPAQTIRGLSLVLSEGITASVLSEALAACHSNPDTSLSLIIAVLGAMDHDQHQAAHSVICDHLRRIATTMAANSSETTTQRFIFRRLDLLFTCLYQLQLDAQQRILPKFPDDPAFSTIYTAIVERLGDEENFTPRFDTLCKLLQLTRDLDGRGDFFTNIAYWAAHSEVRRDLTKLSKLLTLTLNSRRAGKQILAANAAVIEAISAAFPTVDDLRRHIFDSTSLTSTNEAFEPRCNAAARILLILGRETDLATLFTSVAAALAERPDLRVRLAKLLVGQRSRWSITFGNQLLSEVDLADTKEHKVAMAKAKMATAEWWSLERVMEDVGFTKQLPSALKFEIYLNLCHFDNARSALAQTASETLERIGNSFSLGDFNRLLYCKRESEILAFLYETGIQLNVPGEAKPKGIIVIMDKQPMALLRVPLLALAELKRNGYVITALHPGLLRQQVTGIQQVDQIHSQFGHNTSCTRWHSQPYSRSEQFINKWEIDLQEKILKCNGIDLYSGLSESLRCEFRVYSIDYSHPFVMGRAARYIAEMDLVIGCMEELRKIGVKLQIPVRVISANNHLTSGYAARAAIREAAADTDIKFFGSGNGYDEYFQKVQGVRIATTIVLQDLTTSPQSKSTMASKAQFERWYEDQWLKNRVAPQTQVIESIVFRNRLQREEIDASTSELLDRLAKSREQGTPVIVVFGKILFDQGDMCGGGPAHTDMRDWFDHCISLARSLTDSIFLIKPHPQEIRDEVATFANEVLADWMPKSPPSNVIFLKHDQLNAHELSGFIDLGIVWAGSVSLELGILNVPCVVCAWTGIFDYPAGYYVPQDRLHFEELVRNAKNLASSPEAAKRSAALIEFMKSEHVTVPYRYTLRALTNRALKPSWIAEDLLHYRQNGDPYVKLLADRLSATRTSSSD